MTDKKKASAKDSTLTGIQRAVPIILLAIAVFTLFCFITQDIGALGHVISAGILGLFSYGAYAIPLLLALHAIFYTSDMKENRVLPRVIFSLIAVTFISALSYAIEYWSEELTFNLSSFIKNGQNTEGGGLIGSIVGFCLIKICGRVGLIIVAVAVFAIYISYFFSKGQSGISKALYNILKFIVCVLAFTECKIKELFGSVKNAKDEKIKRNAEQKNLELTDDEFFAVDNGMQKLSVSQLDIKETRDSAHIEANPTLHDKVFYKSAVSKEEAEEMAKREKAEEMFYSAHVEDEQEAPVYVTPRRRIVNVSFDDPDEQSSSSDTDDTNEAPVTLEQTVVSAVKDDNADSIFTQSFDPFGMVMSEDLATKRSSRSLLDEAPRKKKPVVTEDVFELTEEDIERKKQLEEFEKRKAALLNARRAAIPVDNDGEFKGTQKSVDFREHTTEKYGAVNADEAPASSFIFDKVERKTESPKAEPANYTAIGFGLDNGTFTPPVSQSAFTVPETIYSYEPKVEEKPVQKSEGSYSTTQTTHESAPSTRSYVEEDAVQIFERKIPTSGYSIHTPASEPNTVKYESASDSSYTVNIPAVEEKPAVSYAEPVPAVEEKPAFGYVAPTPAVEEKPTFGYAEPTPAVEEKPTFGYAEPTPAVEEKPTFAYAEPTPAVEEKPTLGYVAPTPAVEEKPTFGYVAPAPAVEDKPTFGYVAPTPAVEEKPTFGYAEPTPAVEEKPTFGYAEPAPAVEEKPAFSYAATKDFDEEKNDEYVPEFKPYVGASAEEASEPEVNTITIEEVAPQEVSTLTIERERINDVDVADDEDKNYTQDVVIDDEDEDEEDAVDESITPPDDDDGGFETEEIPPEEQNPVVQTYHNMFSALREDESQDDNTEEESYDEPEESEDDEDEYNDNYDEDEDYDTPPFDYSSIRSETKAKPEKAQKEEKPEKKKPDFSNYKLPPIDLLGLDPVVDDDTSEINENTKILIDTLASFGVTASIKGVDRGPRITRYEIVPARGVKVQSIMNLQNDITLALAGEGIRFEAPIPGKSAIGIEIPNKKPKNVRLRELLECDDFKSSNSKTFVAVGKDVAGNPVFGDIAKYPHALICGATGTGKSVCINSLLISMLYHARPDEVRLIMIDPKMVEFNMYSGIPHLLIPVITESKQAAGALMWAVEEMQRRYEIISKNNVRNTDAYNEKAKFDPSIGETLPKIVIVIDELADLMMQVRDPVEDLIMRIAQKARAAGIHLLIGTQRPSVQVVTGNIKANITSRIACKVTSQVDSRTILDDVGAEKLIGRGDMLYSPSDRQSALRVQGAFVSDKEVENVMEFIKSQVTDNAYDDEVFAEINKAAQKCGNKKSGGVSADDIDDDGEECGYYSDQQFLDAVELAIRSQKISTSLLQRKLSIGYGKAAKYIDAMEEIGIVSEPNGRNPRNILLSMDEWREKLSRVDLG